MVSIEQLVPEKHTYRRLKQLLDFDRIARAVTLPQSDLGAIGYGRVRLILCLIEYGGSGWTVLRDAFILDPRWTSADRREFLRMIGTAHTTTHFER